MSLRNHIDIKRIKRLHKKKIIKEKILQRQQLILAELAEIEAEEFRHVNWRQELEEGMTTSDMGMINLPGDPNTIQTSMSDTSLSSADNDGSPDENGVVVRVQNFQTVDTSRTDTITVTISGSFSTKTVDGFELNDKVSIGVLVGGTYNYLAQNLGNGTHTISIPSRFQKASVRFDAIQVTAFQGESGTVSITGIGLKRVVPKNILVPLDDPEAVAFIRGGLGGSEERRAKLKDMLEASNELMIRLGLEPNKTSPGDIELAQRLPYTDEDDAFDDPYYKGPPPDLDDDSDFDPNDFEYAGSASGPRGTGGKSAGDPNNIQWPRNKYPNKKAPPGPGYRPPTA